MHRALASFDAGATGWVLAATALVMLMTPGVGFFYGGMVRRNNVLGIIMQSFVTIGVVTVCWVVLGFSLTFASGNPLIGGRGLAGLTDLEATVPGMSGAAVPLVAFAGFHLMIAIFAPALVTGATAERWRFRSFLIFVVLWSLLVYAPVARWVFSPKGWAHRFGALDFAGGIAIHVNAGAAALAMVIVLGRRRGWPEEQSRPHNLPLVMIGAALLWFGWLGCTGGFVGTANEVSAVAVFNTQVSGAVALLAWIAVERLRFGKGTTVGAASGVVAGLVAITPAAGYVTPLAAVLIGAMAGAFCQLMVGVKFLLKLDDSLDVVVVHLGGGVIGSLCVGLFATKSVNADGADGLFSGGGYGQLGAQAVAVGAVVAYTLPMTLLIGGLINRLIGNRVRPREELAGLDLVMHGESAYELGEARWSASARVIGSILGVKVTVEGNFMARQRPPAPLGPKNPKMSPLLTVMLTSFIPWLLP